jgi:hypothetical protein
VLSARQVEVLVDEVAKVIAAQKKAHLRIRRRRRRRRIEVAVPCRSK